MGNISFQDSVTRQKVTNIFLSDNVSVVLIRTKTEDMKL